MQAATLKDCFLYILLTLYQLEIGGNVQRLELHNDYKLMR